MTRLVEDRQLLEQFRRGERVALAAVYREYVRPLHALISGGFSFESEGRELRFSGYREPWAVENAIQEVFARAFAPAARERYDGLRPYRNYLFTIARNLIIDGLRARSSERSARELELSSELPSASSPEQELLERQVEAHCQQFVSSLAVDEQELFRARFVDGLSVESASSLLGISEHRVKSVERRVRKRFFVHMRECGYFEGYRLGDAGVESLALFVVLVARARIGT